MEGVHKVLCPAGVFSDKLLSGFLVLEGKQRKDVLSKNESYSINEDF